MELTQIILVYGPLIVSGCYIAEKAFLLISKLTPTKDDDVIAQNIDAIVPQVLDLLGFKVNQDGTVVKQENK